MLTINCNTIYNEAVKHQVAPKKLIKVTASLRGRTYHEKWLFSTIYWWLQFIISRSLSSHGRFQRFEPSFSILIPSTVAHCIAMQNSIKIWGKSAFFVTLTETVTIIFKFSSLERVVAWLSMASSDRKTWQAEALAQILSKKVWIVYPGCTPS